MAQNKREAGEAKLQEALHLRQRQAINDAYATLEGKQAADTFAAYTLEEALDARITEIEGPPAPTHMCLLDEVESIRNKLKTAAEEIKLLPPEMFRDEALSDSVNTPEDEED